jgi:probable rRNA maturation factor
LTFPTDQDYKNHAKVQLNTPSDLSFGFDLSAYIKTILTLTDLDKGFYDFTFVTNAKIVELNKEFLNRTYETDIISFNLGDSALPIGDIYISYDQANLNSKTFKTSFDYEVQQLIIHGILHLLDYQDYTDAEKKVMLTEQNRLWELANQHVA